MYVLGQDGEREPQSWVKPCLGWFGSSWEPSVHTQPSAEQSDFLLFYWFGGQIGFNKRKENNFKASHPESTVICLQHSRTLKKGGSASWRKYGDHGLGEGSSGYLQGEPIMVMAN